MTTPKNPFAKHKAQSGEGEIVVRLLQPGKQALTTFEYQYPLKLIAPDPHKVTLRLSSEDAKTSTSVGGGQATRDVAISTVFLLTYGGGLIAGDSINLTITLESDTRLALLTQGSTKIFKSKDRSQPATSHALATSSLFKTSAHTTSQTTRQILNVKISANSALCYLPDPNQPFANSIYAQQQTFYIDPYGSSSLLFLDWVSEGRSSRGEHWTLTSWTGRNEVREFDPTSKGRLLLRDSLHLFSDDLTDLHLKTDSKGIFGTLIIGGPTFKPLSDFFMREFRALPRLGAKNWTPAPKTPTILEAPTEEDEESNSAPNSPSRSTFIKPAAGKEDYFNMSITRKNTRANTNGHILSPLASPRTPTATAAPRTRQSQHRKEDDIEGLLWTAAQSRGFVLVKFGAKDVDDARRWLGGMLRREGTVEREMGHQALLCLR